MSLKAIITVAYSDVSDIDERLDVEENFFSITPLHADLDKHDACFEICSDLYEEMLEELIFRNKIEISHDNLYHTIFKVNIKQSVDYFGEGDLWYDLEIIDHMVIGTFDDDNNVIYKSKHTNR